MGTGEALSLFGAKRQNKNHTDSLEGIYIHSGNILVKMSVLRFSLGADVQTVGVRKHQNDQADKTRTHLMLQSIDV